MVIEPYVLSDVKNIFHIVQLVGIEFSFSLTYIKFTKINIFIFDILVLKQKNISY